MLLAVVAAVVLGACGQSGTPVLSIQEKAKVADAEATLNAVVLDGRDPGHARKSLQVMLGLCKAKADALYDRRTVAEVAADEAESLRGYRTSWAGQLTNHCRG